MDKQRPTASHLEAPRQKRTKKVVEKRIEQLKVFKAKHGHVRVTVKQDPRLASFCHHMGCARRGTGGGSVMTISEVE